jgi:hypothetical protein
VIFFLFVGILTIACRAKIYLIYFIYLFMCSLFNYPTISIVYSLPNIVQVVKSRRMKWAEHVARMGEDRVVHRLLVEKPEGKRPLGRPRRRWGYNIEMDLQEVGGGVVGIGWSWLRIGTGGGHLWVR